MSSFLNQITIDNLTGIFDRHFSTFSSGIGNFITIIKEPIQIINNSSSTNIYGYPSDSLNNSDVTYQAISGIYPAMILYPGDLKEQIFTQIKTSLDINDVMIKVKSECKDYIMSGKTEGIIINGLRHNVEQSPKIQNYFGSLYYYFKCTLTQ